MRKEKLTTILYIALTMIFLVGMFLYEDNHPLEDFLTEYRNTVPAGTPVLERIQGAIDAAETIMIRDTYRREDMNELFGLTQRLLGKSILPDPAYGEIYRTDFGQITYRVEKKDVRGAVQKTLELKEKLDQEGIPLLFVLAPFKVDGGNSGLPPHVTDYADVNGDRFLAEIQKEGVAVLDLRDSLRGGNANQKELFFDTDHHWRIETAFDATWTIGRQLNEAYGFQIDEKLMDIGSYGSRTYDDFFLGSMGRRTGFRYAGVDDFTYIYPEFPTDMTVEQIDGAQHLVTRGDFSASMINPDNLSPENPPDTNRYAVYKGDHEELIFRNHLEGEGRILMIKDSFALPVYSFLAPAVSELRALDMRFFKRNAGDYAADYQPDVVIILYNGDCFNEEMFDFKLEMRTENEEQ